VVSANAKQTHFKSTWTIMRASSNGKDHKTAIADEIEEYERYAP